MTHPVELTPRAVRDFEALPVDVRVREGVLDALDSLGRFPHSAGIKPLDRMFLGAWRLAVGKYRVIFHLEDETVIVDRICDRARAYRGNRHHSGRRPRKSERARNAP